MQKTFNRNRSLSTLLVLMGAVWSFVPFSVSQAASSLPSSPDYVAPLKRPSVVPPFLDVNKYANIFSPYDGYKVLQPHVPATSDERYNPEFFPEYVHELVDLRADLTNVQDNVSRLSVQQFNNPGGSTFDPRCDSLDARVRQLEQQIALLTNTANSGTGGPDFDLSDDPNIQTMSRRLTNVEAVAASNDSLIKRVMKFLKLK